MKIKVLFVCILVLLLNLVIGCKKDEQVVEDMQHSDGNDYIKDNPDINKLTISSLDDLGTPQISLIKDALINGADNQINLSDGSKNFKFVLKKYQNITVFDNGEAILLAVGYVNNYKKNRAYMFITKQGDLHMHFVLDNVFYIIKKSKNDKYFIININHNEVNNTGIMPRINRTYTNRIKNKEPILVTPDFLNNNHEQIGDDINPITFKRGNKLSKSLNVVINVSGSYPDTYPGSLYDQIYAMVHSFYSAFLTQEDNGLNLAIAIYIYSNRKDTTPWNYDSEEYLKSWKNNALLVYPEFKSKADNTIFVNMHLDKQWDLGETIGRAYVLTNFGLGKFVIVGYANQFYHGSMQTLAHEVGHSLGAVHANETYKKYDMQVYDVMQAYTGLSDPKFRYREDHLSQSNIRRMIFNWK